MTKAQLAAHLSKDHKVEVGKGWTMDELESCHEAAKSVQGKVGATCK